MDIREQIDSLLTGERRSLSVHEQWKYAQSLKKLLKVYELVIEQSHLCADKRCIGLFPEEGKHRCRLCTEMLAAVTAIKEQK